MSTIARRSSYVFLCAIPFVTFSIGSIRALRIPLVYRSTGGLLFAAIVLAAWILGARAIGAERLEQRLVAAAGVLLLLPFALVGLFWVGLGPPWEATPPENQMRYLGLSVMAVAVVGGFVVLRQALSDAGERFYCTLGVAGAVLSGPLYLVFNAFELATVRTGHDLPGLAVLGEVVSHVLFLAGVLTYLTTAAFAASLGRAGWIRIGASRAYIILNILAVILLALRGLQFPDPAALSTPWYTRPGFIVGIPAIPWLMPCLLGVLLLRRAGDEWWSGHRA